MTRKFTQSIFILLFLNLLVKPFWIFGIDRTIQNRVGAEEYGLYFSLFGFSLLLNMITDLGITNFNNRNIAQNHDQLDKQLGILIPVKLILSLLYCVITLSIAVFIGYTSRQFSLLIWLIVNQMLASFILYLRSNISALQMFKTESVISVIDKLLTIIFCSILLWGINNTAFRIEWLVLTQSLSYSITLVIVLFILFRKSGKIKLNLNLKTIKQTLRLSFPFALLAVLMMFYTRVDAVMIERMLPNGQKQAGIYAQAFRISDTLSMFAVLFASILLPLFAKMIKDKVQIGDTLSHSFAMLVVPAIALITPLMFSAKEFMQLLYQQHSHESAKVLYFLLIGFGGICLNYIFGTFLTAAGKLLILNKIAFTGLVLNVVLNLFLISAFEAVGAAIASSVTQLLLGTVSAFISFRIMNIQVRIITFIKYAGLVLSAIILSILFKLLFSWYIALIIVACAITAIGVFLKLIKIENLKQAIK